MEAENKNTKKEISSNMLWRFADKWGSQIISLIITTIIARILEPEAYGTVAIINAFINIFSVFSDCGLSDSLIQKKDADDLDYSTAFIANTFLCITIYLVIFACSPLIAKFYNIDSLTILIRVSAISILISAYKNIQHAYVAKKLMFKKYFFASIIGTVGSGILGILMAINGYGVWALIISNLFDMAVDTLCCMVMVSWRFKIGFSFERLKRLFNFGSKILLVNFIERIYNKLYQLVIGKFYTSEDLAFFDKGDNLSGKLISNVDYSISSVLFPVMSDKQNEKDNVKKIAKETLKINFYIVTPLLIGLAIVAEPLIKVVFTDKWLPAVPFVRIFCIIRLFVPINTININIIRSLGRSDIYLKQQSMKRILNILILILTAKYGVMVIAYGLIVNAIKDVIIQAYPCKKLIEYSLIEQFKDVLSTVIIGLVMGTTVYFVGMINLGTLEVLIIQIVVGIAIYVGTSIITKNNNFYSILNAIRNK